MKPVSSFVYSSSINMFLLLCFLLFSDHLSKALSSNPSRCSSSFECKNFGNFSYPFYNSSTSSHCGFLKLDCNKPSPELQLQDGKILEIKNVTRRQLMLVSYKTFDKRLNLQNCDVVNRYALSRGLEHIQIPKRQKRITLYKCSNTSSVFDQYRKIECDDHFLYYNETMEVLTNNSRPKSCVLLQLPYNETRNDFDDLFSLLPIEFFISFRRDNRSCSNCQEIQGQCQVLDQKFICIRSKEKNNSRLIIVAVVVGFALLMVLAIVFFFIRRTYKRKAFKYFSSTELEDVSVYFGVSVFSYAELEDATNHFDSTKELGDGGFGTVYYGVLRDGREVAVKRLYEHNVKRVQQFMNEVEILTRLRHQNLVSLYGCTSRKSRELLLVYEYIPNGTVADHLHGDRAKPSPLKWRTRMKVAIETANALVYLHASEIIHRDVKTNNILLDNSFCVKVADFGLSRLLPNDVTHVSTAPQGTPGYVDPEYHQCYQLTEKSDVYSFGVVLIELISSMPAIDISRSREEISLANMAINRIQRCALDELIDPFLATDPDTERMMTSVAELAFRCLQFDSESRPTMVEVLEVLKGIRGEESVDDINALDTTTKSKVPPASPENEGAGLLKGLHTASPISVTAKWHSTSSESTTPNTSVLH